MTARMSRAAVPAGEVYGHSSRRFRWNGSRSASGMARSSSSCPERRLVAGGRSDLTREPLVKRNVRRQALGCTLADDHVLFQLDRQRAALFSEVALNRKDLIGAEHAVWHA